LNEIKLFVSNVVLGVKAEGNKTNKTCIRTLNYTKGYKNFSSVLFFEKYVLHNCVVFFFFLFFQMILLLSFVLSCLLISINGFIFAPTPIPQNFSCDMPIVYINTKGKYIGLIDIKVDGSSP
jgi:hypothetical protein